MLKIETGVETDFRNKTCSYGQICVKLGRVRIHEKGMALNSRPCSQYWIRKSHQLGRQIRIRAQLFKKIV